MAEHRVIIDCDPGHDDFAAIALANHAPSIHIEAIIAVNGNAPLVHTCRNALSIAAALDLDCPVYAGAELPLLHRYPYPSEFHGVTGMDSIGAPMPPHDRKLAEGHGALEIIKRVRAAPGEITVVTMGPMTDLALALSLDPGIAPLVREFVFMGGGLSTGNVTARAEFNIWADPEAAAIVLQAGMTTTMFGLDVTNEAWLAPDDMAAIRAASPRANAVADILQYYTDRSGDIKAGRVPGPAMHDPCPIAWLIDPSLFTLEVLPVEIGTERGPFYGTTHADRRAWAADASRIAVATDLDRPRLAKLMTKALAEAAAKIGSASS